MIIVQLIGGLGNQMFQYAVGRNLAYRLSTQLKLDVTQLHNCTDRKYNLGCYNIKETFASPQDLDRVRQSGIRLVKEPIRAIRQMICRQIPIRCIKERHFHFDPEILTLPDNRYLEGYWQSEKYFKDIEEIIRRDFSFKFSPDPLNKKIGDHISSVESISLHLRRGDYINNPKTYKTHGICGINYYREAIEKIMQKIDKPHFFVFSDDPVWAKSNVTANAPIEYISHNQELKNYEDLRLMSLCRYHIIANSSFSWWGAWTCANPNKIVITPKNWFNQSRDDITDLIPASWYRL